MPRVAGGSAFFVRRLRTRLMKSFLDFLTRPPDHDGQRTGLSLSDFTHIDGRLLFLLLCAIVVPISLFLFCVLRPQTRFVRRAYFCCTAVPILWGIIMTAHGVFRVLDILAQGGGHWASGMGELQPLPDVLSAIVVYLLTGVALTALFLLCGLLLPKRQHEVA